MTVLFYFMLQNKWTIYLRKFKFKIKKIIFFFYFCAVFKLKLEKNM